MKTKTAQHTPGPWIVQQDGKVFDVVTQNGQGITACSCADQIDPKEDEANARLIASAPELLEMLYTLLPCAEESDEFNTPECKYSPRVRALIAKVEGRNND